MLNTDVRTLFIPGRQIDDAFLTEIEEKLLQSDMGVQNVDKIVGEIRDRWRLGKIKNADQADGVMRETVLVDPDRRRQAGRPRPALRTVGPDGHPGRRHQRRGQDDQHRQARLAAEERR